MEVPDRLTAGRPDDRPVQQHHGGGGPAARRHRRLYEPRPQDGPHADGPQGAARRPAELAGEQKFALYDFGEQTTKARCDEAAFVDALGEGTIAPELAGKADYYVFGYLTTLGKVKAQSGALGLSGRDRTVYAELSLRVMDAHTGAIVFVTKADSRRKAELSYNAIWQRHDSGEEDAIRAALEDAAINLAAQFKQAM